jgi:hypothetical protein
MANYSINIPPTGNPAPVQMQIGDTLTINFVSAGKFCVESGNANAFNPPLPSGVPESQGPWPSAQGGATASAVTTILYSHAGHDKPCGTSRPTAGISGTIKVGTGK